MSQDLEKRKAYEKAYYKSHKEKISQRQKAWRRDNHGRLKQQAHDYYQTHKRQHAINSQQNRDRRKLEILSRYSNGTPKCAHCGIEDIDVLSLDHINNDGAEHRRSIGQIRHAGDSVYCWAKRNNYPDGFQVLCYNCNMKKEIQHRRLKRTA